MVANEQTKILHEHFGTVYGELNEKLLSTEQKKGRKMSVIMDVGGRSA